MNRDDTIKAKQNKWYVLGYQRGYKGTPYNPPKSRQDREQFEKGLRDGRADYEALK